MSIRLISIGDCCLDNYVQKKKINLGGTAYNVARAAKKACALVSLLSAVGTDTYGVKFVSQLQKQKINTTHVQIIPGTTSSISIHLTKAKPTYFNWDLGVLTSFSLTTADQTFIKAHDIAFNILFKPLEKQFDQFCNMDVPTTLKVGDFAGSSDYSQDIKILEKYKNKLDIFIKSIDSKNTSEISYLKQFAQANQKMVIALCGSWGSMVFANSEVYTQPSTTISKIINTTGAGDTYIGTFLVTYLTSKNMYKSMQKATKAAAEKITYQSLLS